MDFFNKLWAEHGEMFMFYGLRIVAALLVIFVGFSIVNRLAAMAKRGLTKAGVTPSLVPLFTNLIDVTLKIVVFFVVAGILGIATTSLVAVLATAGFAVGLALQGSLSDFAAGILILLFRPFKIGDHIEVQGKIGQVEEIQMFSTVLLSSDFKTFVVPNKKAVDDVVTNFTTKGILRMHLKITIPYEESYSSVRAIIIETMAAEPRVLASPALEIGICGYTVQGVEVEIRPYVKPEYYFSLEGDLYDALKTAFAKNKIRHAYADGLTLVTMND